MHTCWRSSALVAVALAAFSLVWIQHADAGGKHSFKPGGPTMNCVFDRLHSTSPDGKYGVIKEDNLTFRLCDLTSGKVFGKPLKHTGTPYKALVFPTVVITQFDTKKEEANLRMWDVKTGNPIAIKAPLPVKKRQQPILTPSFAGIGTPVSISPDGRLIAIRSGGRFPIRGVKPGVDVYELASGKQIAKKLPIGKGVSSWLEFDATGKRLIGKTMNQLEIWDVEKGVQIGKTFVAPAIPGADGFRLRAGYDFNVSNSGKWALVAYTLSPQGSFGGGSPKSHYGMHSLQSGKSTGKTRSYTSQTQAVSFSADEKLFAFAVPYELNRPNKIVVANVKTFKPVHVIQPKPKPGTWIVGKDVQFNKTGDLLLVSIQVGGERAVQGAANNHLQVLDVKTGKAIAKPLSFHRPISQAKWCSDGKSFIVQFAQPGAPLHKFVFSHVRRPYTAETRLWTISK